MPPRALTADDPSTRSEAFVVSDSLLSLIPTLHFFLLCSMVAGKDVLGGSGGVHSQLYAMLLGFGGIWGAFSLRILKTRGYHTRFIVAYYQEVASTFMIVVFYLWLALHLLREQLSAGWLHMSKSLVCMYV